MVRYLCRSPWNSRGPEGLVRLASRAAVPNTATPSYTVAARRSWESFRASGRRCGVAEEIEDPWLCGPGFRRVCLFGCVNSLRRGSGTVKETYTT
jgi:hypothetical protein